MARRTAMQRVYVDDPGDDDDEVIIIETPRNRGGADAAASTCEKVARLMKSGNINQGYSQCNVDLLALMVAAGKCSPERIQCREMATLRMTAVAAGAVVIFTLTPVGRAFARELIVGFSAPDVAVAPDYVPIILQATAKGRVAVTGTVASTGLGNVPTGFPAQAFSGNFQNYVLPSGIIFTSAQPLLVTATNAGADAGSSVMGLSYDQVREG